LALFAALWCAPNVERPRAHKVERPLSHCNWTFNSLLPDALVVKAQSQRRGSGVQGRGSRVWSVGTGNPGPKTLDAVTFNISIRVFA
jgi:hypothetical protein